MDELTKLFATVMTPDRMAEAEAKALRSLERDLSTRSKNISALPPDPATNEMVTPIPKDGDSIRDQWREMMEQPLHLQYPPPTALPCANVQPAKYKICKNPGTMACSACKLVSYCSKECQITHWKEHKYDCKNFIRSTDWTPSWIRESRSPLFMTDAPDNDDIQHLRKEEFSASMSSLWGNTPAVDVINLACNENDAKRDFSLAFIASGDLRHVLRSFNGLPSDYSGHLNILINDFSPFVFCRNVALLLILANVSDEAMAADMALHFWYSVFMPSEYQLQLSVILLSFLQQLRDSGSIPLGPRSTLSTSFPEEFLKSYLLHFFSSSYSMEDIQGEYDRVRTAPSRQDYRDRMYASLKPAHRVAFQQYRRFGIVLPFGAMSAHFNCPNLSLFSPKGKWLQTDYADPLAGWDIPAIIETGKAHGAYPEDIYGCLYFFLSKQLRTFASRLRRFSSSFTILPMDARQLPHLIRENEFSEFKIPASIKFDRIEVSNILDINYVGIHDVLTMWGPLLQESKSAAIIGYFMNWTKLEKTGRGTGAGERVMKDLVKKLMDKEKLNVNSNRVMTNSMKMQSILLAGVDDKEAFYENSQPFFKFLQSQGLDGLLKKTGLRLRDKHAIVPHRILAPLEGPPTALPEISDDDTWYYYTKLTCYTWSERYVEFERE